MERHAGSGGHARRHRGPDECRGEQGPGQCHLTEAFTRGGIASLSGTPAQFADFIRSEIAKYAEIARKADIRLDN